MGLVQFREDDDLLAFLRASGHNPNQLARELLEAHARKMRWKAKADYFRKNAEDLGDVVGEIRRMRDER